MTRADVVVLALALALLPLLYVEFWHHGAAGEAVRIRVDGKPYKVVSLAHDRRVVVHGALGDSVLQIKDGAVRFVASPCTSKFCIHSGWQHDGGAFTACLPNRVSIEVIGSRVRYDAINF